jgi:hypothetical protein
MKQIGVFGASIIAVVAACALWRGLQADPVSEPAPAASGFAVVELFTSEGCSSCPPADKLLGEVVREATEKKAPIYALAYHVDYWDRLGWKDPFGSKLGSERQTAYAEALGATVYTPQAVVNGAEEFVGSEGDRLRKSVQTALARPATAKVALRAKRTEKPGRIAVHYEVTDAPAGSVLQVAYVEEKLSTDVKRGENGGRTLTHFHVVRAFQTVELARDTKGDATLDVTEPKTGSVIAFMQDPKKLKILGAAAAEVGKE